MKRLVITALAALSLSACAMLDIGAPAPAAPTGPATQAGWDAGQTAYLQWNGQRRGWTTTESGLQYRRVGRAHPDGAQPGATDTVSVHYRGVRIDGFEFDSSFKRGEPASFPLNRVIRGWTEGVALMRVGETFEFAIPAGLAYGGRQVGADIPPNSTLIFTVELLDVTSAG